MKESHLILAVCAVFLLFSSVRGEDEKFSVEGRYWIPSFSTSLRVGDSQDSPTKVDEDMLDLKRKNFLDLRASFKLAEKHALRLGYTPINYKGSTVITETIRFGDQVFAAGNLVESKLKLDYLRLGWLMNLIDNKKGLRLGGILEVKGYMAKASLEAPQQPAKHTYKLRVGVPTIGGLLEAEINRYVGLYAEATGVTVGSRGYLLDGEAAMRFSFHKNFQIQGGYRMYSVKFKRSDDYFRLRTDGPYLGLRLLF